MVAKRVAAETRDDVSPRLAGSRDAVMKERVQLTVKEPLLPLLAPPSFLVPGDTRNVDRGDGGGGGGGGCGGGGGWKGGSKERLPRFADPNALLKAGISVVAINYRYVTSTEKPPVKAPLADAARALQFVRSKAKEWNLDKKRIGAAGGSAGACSSLWLAFHDDLANPKSKDPVARESSRLSCAAVTGAQTTLDPKQMKEWTPNSKYGAHAFGLRNFSEFLAKREKIMPWIKEYSPYANVTADDPAVYLIYSSSPALGKEQRDPTHTSNFGVKLQEHCKSKGVECELVYPGAPDVRHKSPTEFLISKLRKN